MIRRDYLLRLIEQAIRLIQAVFGLIELRRYPEALAMLNEGFRQFFGMDSDTLTRLPLNYLREQIGEDPEGTALMAALLEAEGDVLILMEREEAALARWERAITLMLEGERETWWVAQSGISTTVATLAKRLRPYTLPPELNALLFRHYERVGNFAQAENHLWEWLDSGTGDHDEAQQFYGRLLAMDDAALKAGGLTREEVEASRAELEL